jgi:hypothetical protein
MKSLGAFTIGACALALCASPLASAKPVGTLSCTAAKTGQFKFNISAFSFGAEVPVNIGSSGSGAGAGKVTLKPLEVHAALATFGSLLIPATDAEDISTCTLTTSFGDGSQTEFEFKNLVISSITAQASMPAQANEPSRYTDVIFVYESVLVKTTTSADDGGSTPAAGWNVTANQRQ